MHISNSFHQSNFVKLLQLWPIYDLHKRGNSYSQAEILTVNFKLPTGKIFSVSTFYRVETLGTENFDSVKSYLGISHLL